MPILVDLAMFSMCSAAALILVKENVNASRFAVIITVKCNGKIIIIILIIDCSCRHNCHDKI
jgi:hypothetical protein